MRNFPTIQIDRLKFLGAYSIGHAGQGIIGEGELTLRRHYHGNQYELTCILEGEGTSYHGNTPQHVQAGDIYVSFPLEYHKIEVTPGTIMRQCFVTFSVNSGKYFEKLNHLWLDNIAPENRVFRDPYVPGLIEKIVGELQNNALYASDVLAVVMEEIILRVLRGMASYEPQGLTANTTAEDLCRHVSHYIDTHLYTIKHLSEVAEAVSYNYSYLSSCFKKTTGQTMTDYYVSRRLQAAKALIEEQTQSLTEIARTLGYSGIYSFSKAFRDYYGYPPREYQNSLKK